MVSFIIGRTGSGKTHRIINEMKSETGNLILLVPEQSSHMSERLLCEIAGDEISAKAEVLSFNRLCDRIFTCAGGLSNRVVDGGGRILIMHRALQTVRNQLRALGGAAAKPEFLENLIEITEELKTCCIKPERLFGLGDGIFADKLHDIALIATAYEGAFKNNELDPADKIARATAAAKSSGFFKSKKIWIDGYSGFTPQEIELLRVAFAQSEYACVALCLNDDPEAENGAFAKTWRTYSTLSRIAGESNITRLASSKRFKKESLKFLEKNLFTTAIGEHDGAVEIYEALNSYEECRIAAAKIKKLVAGGMRYRDIAVCARNFEEYSQILASAFSRFGIPVYENRKQPMLSQAPIAFVLGALRVIADNFRYDDMVTYLKTGLCGLRRKSLDKFESYLYTWQIEGKKWSAEEDFSENPSGRNEIMSEQEKELLLLINKMRKKIRTPLINLRAKIRENPTGHGYAEALFAFFEEIHLARRLEARATLYRMRGEIGMAERYERIWQIIIAALDSIGEALSNMRFSIDDFIKMLSLMFHNTK